MKRERTGVSDIQTNIVLFWWSLGGIIGAITGFVLCLVFNEIMYMLAGFSLGILIGSIIGWVLTIVADKHEKQDSRRTGAENKQIYTFPFFMGLGMGIGAIFSLVFDEMMYMSIGWGIGTVIALLLKKFVVNKKQDQKDHSETSDRWHLR